MKRFLATGLMAGLILAVPVGAGAQTTTPNEAVIRGIIRLVKKIAVGQRALQDAPVGTKLAPGERIRTGGRSAAGIRFPDQSIIRVGELSEVVITDPRRRDTQVVRGQILASYRAPGRITGGSAIAAVRGTDIHFTLNPETGETEVRCYDGQIFVSSADNPIATGVTSDVTPTTLTDASLIGQTDDYAGGEIRFLDGPYKDQKRSVSAFDRASGRVTFGPPLTGANSGPTTYLLVKRPGQPVVQLDRNSGTSVAPNRAPRAPYGVPPDKHAYINQNPPLDGLSDGAQLTYPGTDGQVREQGDQFLEREAIRDSTPAPPGEPFCDFGPAPKFLRRGPRTFATTLFGQGGGAAPMGGPAQPERLFGAGPLAVPAGAQNVLLRFEPFGITSKDTDILGARFRVQAAEGDVYSEFGYRYTWIDSDSQHDLSEAFVQVKGDYGRLILGRQHMFIGPANNTRVGTLLDLESSDTFAYELPVRKGLSLMGGYVHDSDTFLDGGFQGGFVRAQRPFRGGMLGASMLFNRESGTNLGWSLDLSQPVIPNTLDIYAEGGVDSHSHTLYSAGFYVPALYHATGIDLYLEYARREDVDERLTLRLRRSLGAGLLGVLFLDNRMQGDDHLNFGGGLLWSKAFR